jgi:hypothetical protein
MDHMKGYEMTDNDRYYLESMMQHASERGKRAARNALADIDAMKTGLEAHQISLKNLREELEESRRNSQQKIRNLEWELEETKTALRLANHRARIA